MTVAELIEAMRDLPPDTQVRVYADHGQSCMRASSAGLMTVAKEALDLWMCDTIHPDEVDEYSKDDLAYVFEISAP